MFTVDSKTKKSALTNLFELTGSSNSAIEIVVTYTGKEMTTEIGAERRGTIVTKRKDGTTGKAVLFLATGQPTKSVAASRKLDHMTLQEFADAIKSEEVVFSYILNKETGESYWTAHKAGGNMIEC